MSNKNILGLVSNTMVEKPQAFVGNCLAPIN